MTIEGGLMLKAVLFDIDGTLVDSTEQHVAAWMTAFGDHGHPQTAVAIRAQVGKGGDLLVPTLLPGVSETERKRIADAHGRVFTSRYLKGIRAFSAAADLLRRAHAEGLKVVLASSAAQDEVDHYARLLGVADLLAATISIDDVGTSKPAPDIFGAALERIGVAAAEALVVGDTPYDVEAARRAGIAAVGVTTGPFDAATLREAGAIAVYADVAALLAEYRNSPVHTRGRRNSDSRPVVPNATPSPGDRPMTTASRSAGLSAPAAAALALGAVTAALLVGRRSAPSPDHPRTRRWYRRLAKPDYTPPSPVYPIAWTAIQAGMAYGGYRLLRAEPSSSRTAALVLWTASEAGIGGWSAIFFGQRATGAATLASAALGASATGYVAAASGTDRAAAWAGAPLIGWVAFATLLSEEIWRRNPEQGQLEDSNAFRR